MPDRHASGFTLLEVLIALVIAALALGALFSGAVTGLHSTRLAAHYQEAISRARSHLAVIGHAGPIAPGEQTGEDGGGFRWLVRVVQNSTAALPNSAPRGAPQVALYDVVVVISWKMDGASRTVSLQSQRIGVTVAATP